MNMTNHMHSTEWQEGRTAARKGAHPEMNPYLDGVEQTFQSRLWADGHLYGREEIEREQS